MEDDLKSVRVISEAKSDFVDLLKKHMVAWETLSARGRKRLEMKHSEV